MLRYKLRSYWYKSEIVSSSFQYLSIHLFFSVRGDLIQKEALCRRYLNWKVFLSKPAGGFREKAVLKKFANNKGKCLCWSHCSTKLHAVGRKLHKKKHFCTYVFIQSFSEYLMKHISMWLLLWIALNHLYLLYQSAGIYRIKKLYLTTVFNGIANPFGNVHKTLIHKSLRNFYRYCRIS